MNYAQLLRDAGKEESAQELIQAIQAQKNPQVGNSNDVSLIKEALSRPLLIYPKEVFTEGPIDRIKL